MMKLIHSLALVVAFMCSLTVNAQLDCSSWPAGLEVTCSGPTQILFIVDQSKSVADISIENTYKFIKSIKCGFPDDSLLQLGVITFNDQVRYPVPLDSYSASEWNTAIDGVNKTKDMFTPLAEALFLARQAFEKATNAITPQSSQEYCQGSIHRVAFVMSDGHPEPNDKIMNTVPGFNPFPTEWIVKKTADTVRPPIENSTIYYIENIVPRQATLLKNLYNKVRLVFFGMKDATGVPSAPEYFKGSIVQLRKCTSTATYIPKPATCQYYNWDGTSAAKIALRSTSQCNRDRKLTGSTNPELASCMQRDLADPHFPIASAVNDVHNTPDMAPAVLLNLLVPSISAPVCFT